MKIFIIDPTNRPPQKLIRTITENNRRIDTTNKINTLVLILSLSIINLDNQNIHNKQDNNDPNWYAKFNAVILVYSLIHIL